MYAASRTGLRKKMVDVTLQLHTASHAEVDGPLSSPRRDLPSRPATEAGDKDE